jgi:DNA end-binding protein Ku
MASNGIKKTLSFGLVNVPVRLHSAQEEQKVALRQLSPEGNPIKLPEEVIDSVSQKRYPKAEIHKGFEFVRGQFVEVSPEEIDSARPAKSGVIEVELFVPASQLSPLRVEKAFWLAPDMGGERGYAVMLAALGRSGQVGIAQMVSNGRQHLCALLPLEVGGQPVLSLCQLFYDDEVQPPPRLAPVLTVGEQELALAAALIQAKSLAELDTAGYRDEYRYNLMQLIEAKVNGTVFEAAPQIEARPTGIDLLAALQESVNAAIAQKAGRAGRAGRQAQARPARKRKTA